jgi:hypothetical protein
VLTLKTVSPYACVSDSRKRGEVQQLLIRREEKVRHVALLDTLDAAEINLAINELAGEADRIEAELTGGDTF